MIKMPSLIFKNLKFSKAKTTTSLGRNGTIMTTGIEIGYHEYRFRGHCTSVTSIRPITSRGNVGRCAIEIPADSCPFRALDALIEKTAPKNLPTLMGIHPLLDRLVEAKLSGKEEP
jgi:hypothetical protein